jgi:prepilin-type N-terminal cleavage/methylation domain-containing protein
MSTAPRHARGQPRAGFTIVEVIVAIMILTVGVLGLAGASAVVTRMMGSAEVQSDAASIAATRFETLRGTRCPVASGSVTAGGITERWSATQLGSPAFRMYDVVDSVTYRSRKGQRAQSYRSVVQCLP